MRTAAQSGDVSNNRPARNRRNKRTTELGQLTDELRLSLAQDIYGRMRLKAASAHMGVDKNGRLNVPLDTLKSFLTSVYVNCPRAKFLRAIVQCCFASERTRTLAKVLLARTTGEYGVEYLGVTDGGKQLAV